MTAEEFGAAIRAPKLAMKIPKCATLEDFDDATWPEFADDAGLAAPFVRKRVRELSAAVADATSPVAEKITIHGLSAADLTRFAALVTARAARLGEGSPAYRPDGGQSIVLGDLLHEEINPLL